MKRNYSIPLVKEVAEVRLETDFLQNSIVTDETSVAVREFEDVTSSFDDKFFEAEFK